MDLESDPPWPRKRLKRLGEALMAGSEPPENCPSYEEVMLWHHELAAEVAATISNGNWVSVSEHLRPTARSKTHDTLVQKLIREQHNHLGLDQVQDLAGTRVDLDCALSEQLALAEEFAQHFGTERATVKDIRDQPHSGYRAVHVRLKLPAGRAEIQVRTLAQSVWANTYERFADIVGRGIRYGEIPVIPQVKTIYGYLQTLSNTISQAEKIDQQIRDVKADILAKIPEDQLHRIEDKARRLEENEDKLRQLTATNIERLQNLYSQLDQIGG